MSKNGYRWFLYALLVVLCLVVVGLTTTVQPGSLKGGLVYKNM